jgi:hypothetical protein
MKLKILSTINAVDPIPLVLGMVVRKEPDIVVPPNDLLVQRVCQHVWEKMLPSDTKHPEFQAQLRAAAAAEAEEDKRQIAKRDRHAANYGAGTLPFGTFKGEQNFESDVEAVQFHRFCTSTIIGSKAPWTSEMLREIWFVAKKYKVPTSSLVRDCEEMLLADVKTARQQQIVNIMPNGESPLFKKTILGGFR